MGHYAAAGRARSFEHVLGTVSPARPVDAVVDVRSPFDTYVSSHRWLGTRNDRRRCLFTLVSRSRYRVRLLAHVGFDEDNVRGKVAESFRAEATGSSGTTDRALWRRHHCPRFLACSLIGSLPGTCARASTIAACDLLPCHETRISVLQNFGAVVPRLLSPSTFFLHRARSSPLFLLHLFAPNHLHHRSSDQPERRRRNLHRVRFPCPRPLRQGCEAGYALPLISLPCNLVSSGKGKRETGVLRS
ncbi:hypothetical protein EXIGLDRAFT_111832 [Exidia glandulosa HHB12029]|uniref:Uncharacterized protein n=1 Tax=Exidia glandulosa HHB12029 TaxID=1314781 RepID=A0A165NL82_EXIGL|nr:hypothetical protein EXIGLDRAFT_111832 [Exidia glandulosa HHB12029]